MRIAFFLLVFFAFTINVSAQEQAADSVYALPAIEVSALRMPASSEFAPIRISVLTAGTADATFSKNLAELLDRAGSPFIRRYGSGLATLSFRGTSSSQTLLLLDGVPFSDPQLGMVDLSLLPASIIDEVHLMHGPGASRHGSQGMGGVINLESHRNTDPYFIQVSGMAGPYEDRSGVLSAGFSTGPADGLVSFSHGYERGDFPYLNPSLFPPQNSRRTGADRSHTAAFGKFTFRRHRTATTVSGWLNDTERGLPGPATATPKGERQWDQNSRIQAKHILQSSPGLISFTGALQANALRYANPQIELDQTSRTSAATLEIEWSGSGKPFSVASGISGSLYGARHPALAESARESRISWFAYGDVSSTRAGAFPALRVDAYLPEYGRRLVAVNPSLGFNLQPFAGAPLRFKASFGRAFRTPTFNDRFWQPGGNPDLKPEHGWSYEAGAIYAVERSPAKTSIEISGFSHRTRDQIIWLPAGTQDIWTPQNLGSTKAAGIEASAEASRTMSSKSRISFETVYTFVDTRDLSDKNGPAYDQPLRYTPAHVMKSRLGLSQRTGLMQWRIDLAARYVSRRYVTTDGSQFLPPYWTGDVNLSVTRSAPGATLSAGLSLENVTDEDYEIVKGYPVSPRLLRIHLSARISGKE